MAVLRPLQMSSAILTLNTDTEGWELHVPNGSPRTFCCSVSFETPFPTNPVVHVSLCGFDVDNGSSARIRVRAVDIHPGGFPLQLQTLLETRVYGVDVSWLAMGSA